MAASPPPTSPSIGIGHPVISQGPADLYNLSGRSVLITGGASGIGWATARLFAASGARVMIADIDAEKAASRAAELGVAHDACHADITSNIEVAAMVQRCVDRFGRLDILVNNAGRTDTGGAAAV